MGDVSIKDSDLRLASRNLKQVVEQVRRVEANIHNGNIAGIIATLEILREYSGYAIESCKNLQALVVDRLTEEYKLLTDTQR